MNLPTHHPPVFFGFFKPEISESKTRVRDKFLGQAGRESFEGILRCGAGS